MPTTRKLRPGGRAPTGNAARQADERGADARLGGRNPCDARKEAIPPQPARHRQTGKPLCRSPAHRAMSLPRKAETHATTTRRTPPNRKTPVGARPPGRCRCRARQKPTPPQPAGDRHPGKPLCRSPAPRAMSLSGGVRQAFAGRSAVVRAVEIISRMDDCCPARWRRLQGQQEKPLKTAGCSILPPLPPHPLTKIVTTTGTLPTNCQRLAGGHGGGTGPIRTGKKRILCRTRG